MSKKPERLGQGVMVPDGYVTRRDVIRLRNTADQYEERDPDHAEYLRGLGARIEAMLPSVAR